jgi:hypothetical protein
MASGAQRRGAQDELGQLLGQHAAGERLRLEEPPLALLGGVLRVGAVDGASHIVQAVALGPVLRGREKPPAQPHDAGRHRRCPAVPRQRGADRPVVPALIAPAHGPLVPQGLRQDQLDRSGVELPRTGDARGARVQSLARGRGGRRRRGCVGPAGGSPGLGGRGVDERHEKRQVGRRYGAQALDARRHLEPNLTPPGPVVREPTRVPRTLGVPAGGDAPDALRAVAMVELHGGAVDLAGLVLEPQPESPAKKFDMGDAVGRVGEGLDPLVLGQKDMDVEAPAAVHDDARAR